MKIRTTLALAIATLALGVPVAAAAPDGYQPQLQPSSQPDAFDRYLRNHSTGVEPALGSTGASGHPDSLAVRPGVGAPVSTVEAEAFSWTGIALGMFGGALIVLLAVVGASAMRERRRLVLR
jgi:hypothetical protein